MHTRRLLLIASAEMVMLVGCGRQDAVPDSASAKAPVDSTGPTPPLTPSPSWTITPSGMGPVVVGASVDELRRAVAEVTVPADSGDCQFVRSPGFPNGASVMLSRGVVARIDVDSAGVLTTEGAGVGDTESRVNQLYSGRVTATPHKYVSGGRYLTVAGTSPSDSANRIVFEVDGGRVTRYRAGRVPEVEWVERCG